MLQRAKENFDIQETLSKALEAVTTTGLHTMKLPNMAFDVLRNLVKGKMKINFELTGYDEPLSRLGDMVKNVIIAIFACVIFAGSCTLCTTDIEPQYSGMPIIAIIGFVVSIAMGIYTIKSLIKKKQ